MQVQSRSQDFVKICNVLKKLQNITFSKVMHLFTYKNYVTNGLNIQYIYIAVMASGPKLHF